MPDPTARSATCQSRAVGQQRASAAICDIGPALVLQRRPVAHPEESAVRIAEALDYSTRSYIPSDGIQRGEGTASAPFRQAQPALGRLKPSSPAL
jgi:hypothetical protein